MSWTRFDDNWSDRMSQLGMDFVTRVHYMAMIQFCSRTNKFDGVLKPVDARRASDVDDPQGCLNELMHLNLVTRHVTPDGERYAIVEIDRHVPPPHLRDKPRKEAGASRTQRWRLHKAGDHSKCLPDNCPDAPVTAPVTRHPGTGQDGHGLEELPQSTGGKIPAQVSGHPSPPPGGVDLSTGEVLAPGAFKACTECGSTSGACACFDDRPPVPAPRLSDGTRYDPSMEPPGWG